MPIFSKSNIYLHNQSQKKLQFLLILGEASIHLRKNRGKKSQVFRFRQIKFIFTQPIAKKVVRTWEEIFIFTSGQGRA